MRVLFAAAELAPIARVGGMAEAAAGLVRALRDAGIDVDVVIPDYGPEYIDVVLENEQTTELTSAWWAGPTRVRSGVHPVAGPVKLIQTSAMARPDPYVDASGEGWSDNDRRFMGFAAAVASLARDNPPDVVHLNDWHTAPAVAFMDDWMAQRPPTVLTIHTLGYQGICGRQWLQHLGPDAFRFAWHDATNPLAGAIELVDRVIAVSPNYAEEILSPEAGMGLDGRLNDRGPDLVGIRNGIDVSRWDPAIDPTIAATFTVADRSGKDTCRQALLEEAGWADQDPKPLIAGVVTRLVEQKGVDLLLDTVRYLPGLPLRVAILGSGAADLAANLHRAAEAHPDLIWFHEGYDEALAHRIFAGSDLFLMPSRFEPCGLAQMQAMAYGSIPVVTDVGGLRDTVIDADRDTRRGTGFVAGSVDGAGLVDAMHRAVRAVSKTGRRKAIQKRGMSSDWSWVEPAATHIDVYQAVIDRRSR